MTGDAPLYDRAKCKRLYNEARELRDKKLLDEAKAKFQEAIEVDPTYDWTYILLARIHAEDKNFEKAAEVILSGLTSGVSTADLHYEYYDVQCELQNWNVALEHAHKFMELAPDDFRACNAVAHIHHIPLANPEAASHYYKQALTLKPDSPFALGRLGRIANERGDLDEARRYLERAVAAAAAMGGKWTGQDWQLVLDEVNRKIRKRDQWETLPTIPEMVAFLDRYVCGQERAKRDLATSIYNHFISLSFQDDDVRNPDLGRYNILLFGPSGCGKTYMIELLTKKLGVPLSIVSATSLVQTGYVGKTVESMMEDLLAAAEYNVARAERGIVFIDELDKVRKSGRQSGPDVSGEGVQNGLLTMLEGKDFRIKKDTASFVVNSSKVLFICAGAFDGINEIISSRLNNGRRSLGFASSASTKLELDETALLEQASIEDLEGFGVIPQLAGRFSSISALRVLTRDDLRIILSSMENSIMQKQKKLFELHGISLVFTDEALEAVLDLTNSTRTGARGLRKALSQALRPIAGRVNELSADGIRRVEITAATVNHGEEPNYLTDGPELEARAQFYRQNAFQRMRPDDPGGQSSPKKR